MSASTEIVGPLVLFFLMFIVGLELTLADFRRLAAAPRAVVGGTLAQLLLLPLMTWAVVVLTDLPPVFGAGAVLIAVSPGAGISNILTALAGANTALSVTLTATASVLAVVTLPLLAAVGMGVFLGDSVDVEVPVAALVVQLSLALLLPIALGMTLRARRPDFAARHARRMQRIGFGIIGVLILGGAVFGGDEQLSVDAAAAGLVGAALWTLAAMAIGWGVASALRLPAADRFTFLIEFSARNVAVAAIVAMSGLERMDLALFAAAYVTVGYPLCAAAVLLRRRAVARAA